MNKNRVGLIGYSCGVGASISGGSAAPSTLRKKGLIERLSKLAEVVDFGDASPGESLDKKESSKLTDAEKSLHNVPLVYGACKGLVDLTSTVLEKGMTPFVIGGDHSLSIGSISAVSNYFAAKGEKIGVIWVDTHPDCNTPEESVSKNIHGIGTAVLMGYAPGIFSGFAENTPAVDRENFVYIGLRDVDPPEKNRIKGEGIPAYTMKDIDARGIASVVEEAISIASRDTAGFVVSFDIDACDPSLAPGTGTPIRGGLTFRESHLILEMIVDSGKMKSFELVEVNPKLDQELRTVEFAISLFESAAGKSIL